jgi:hypothetical protein
MSFVLLDLAFGLPPIPIICDELIKDYLCWVLNYSRGVSKIYLAVVIACYVEFVVCCGRGYEPPFVDVTEFITLKIRIFQTES